MPTKPRKPKGRCLDRALTLSLVLTLAFLIALLTLTVIWRNKRTSGFEDQEQTICESCSALTSRTDQTVPKECSVPQNGRCCCKASIVIDTVVKKIAETHFKHYHLPETAAVIKSNCATEEKPSGKIAGLDSDNLKEATEDDKNLVYFKTQTISSVQHSNGRFFISEPGFYYVFSQIKYDHDPDSANSSLSRQSHTLHRYTSNTGHVKLLENTRSFSELHGPENNGTSFIGAVFELKKDDQIMVKSTHTHKLIGGDLENFFGLYII